MDTLFLALLFLMSLLALIVVAGMSLGVHRISKNEKLLEREQIGLSGSNVTYGMVRPKDKNSRAVRADSRASYAWYSRLSSNNPN